MKCISCGHDNPDDAQFCEGCGASLSASVTSGAGIGFSELSMLNFPDAIKIGFERYFDFNGRSTRAEFHWWALFSFVCLIFPPSLIITLIPFLSVSARRLHDINRTGWWLLLWLFLGIGWVILIAWGIRRGDEGTNKYGPDPSQTRRHGHSPFRPRLNFLVRMFLRRL